MFHKEFYPTPIEVLLSLGLDCKGKVCAEPHGGKGDAIEFMFSQGAKEVKYSEIVPELATICANKGGKIVGEDFLETTEGDWTNVQVCFLNPPFSNGAEHILHAWNVMPQGCEIIGLCNWQTIHNPIGSSRIKLKYKVGNYGKFTNLGNVFSSAERKTGVEVGLVRLQKPIVDASSFDFKTYFIDDMNTRYEDEGLIPYDFVRDQVNRHIAAIEKFSEIEATLSELSDLVGYEMSIKYASSDKIKTVAEFIYEHQKDCWSALIRHFKVERFITGKTRTKFDSYLEANQGRQFSMKNIYNTIDVLFQTRDQNMIESMCSMVNNLICTSYYHSKEGRANWRMGEAWKTNRSNGIGTKLIVEGNLYSWMQDFSKVFCYFAGVNLDNVSNKWDFPWNVSESAYANTNLWVYWGCHKDQPMFELKFYKKGTMHLKVCKPFEYAIREINLKYNEANFGELAENLKRD